MKDRVPNVLDRNQRIKKGRWEGGRRSFVRRKIDNVSDDEGRKKRKIKV